MSDTGTEPRVTPEVSRGIVLPRVHRAPRGDQLAPAATVLAADAAPTAAAASDPPAASAPEAPAEPATPAEPARRYARPRRVLQLLIVLGGMAAASVVASAVTIWQLNPPSEAASSEVPRRASAVPIPPTPKWAASVRPVKKSPRARPARRTSRPSATPYTSAKVAAPHWQTRVVRATYVFQPGQSVLTNRISLGLTGDGELVLRDEHGRVAWSSGARASGAYAVFQDDGNLVVYQGDQTVWSSRTGGHGGATLVLRADGTVAIVWGSTVLWKVGGR